MKSERVMAHYSGRVQGIGFRYSCRRLAMGFSVTGSVQNLEDGRVELVAEGDREEVEEFLRAILESHLKPFIRQCTTNWQPATGEWSGFLIEPPGKSGIKN